MSHGCTDCSDQAREKNRSLDSLRITAKQQAHEEKKAKAICEDQVTGLFIAEVNTAIAEHFRIVEIVSGLQQTDAG